MNSGVTKDMKVYTVNFSLEGSFTVVGTDEIDAENNLAILEDFDFLPFVRRIVFGELKEVK